MVFRIVLARVGFALQNYDYLGIKRIILTKFNQNINAIENYTKDTEVLSRLLNLSRALIDSEKSTRSSFLYFTQIKIYDLEYSEEKLFESAKNLFYEILKSQHFKNSVIKTCEQLGYKNEETSKIFEIFVSIPQKVRFVENLICGGMVGFNQIYINNESFFIQEENSILARIIGLMFHEGFHEAQREIFDNFAHLTPRSEDDIEGGLLFEQNLWGSYDITYWDYKHCRNVIDLKRWGNNFEIFSKEELEKRVIRGVVNPRCSGLCIEYIHIGDF